MKDLFDEIDSMELTYEEAREKKEVLQQLLESSGWGLVQELFRQRGVTIQQQLIGMTIQTQEQVASYNNLQGRYFELKVIPQMLESILTDLTLTVKNYQDQAAQETENEDA